jgi:endonuclease/exonuclease/phosphatase (EEP) superfamily protein YafD
MPVSEIFTLKQPGKVNRRICTILVVLYLLFLISVWLLLYFAGDGWWFATFLLFGPRWLYGIPLAILAPWAAWVNRWMLGILAIGLLILAGPLMGLCLPWQRCVSNLRPTLRILTCNVHFDAFDRERFELLMQKELPDVVLIQECPGNFPDDIAALKGWKLMREGEFIIASRYPMKGKSTTRSQFPPSPWPRILGLHCVVETPDGDVGICNIHLTTPREGLSELLDRWTIINPERSKNLTISIANRSSESEEVRAWVESIPSPKIIAGDFNMPTDSNIYRRDWNAYFNAYSRAGFGFGYSKLTPVGCFKYGLRIDHVLMSSEFRPYRAFLGSDIGSDHLPMIADLDIP